MCVCVPVTSACGHPSFSLCACVCGGCVASPASSLSLSLSCSDKSLLRCLGDPRPRLTVTSFLADRKHILIKRGRWGRRSRRKSIRAETSVRALAAANPASFGPALISACCLSACVCVCFSGRIACGTFTLAALFPLKQQQRSDGKVDGLKTTPSRTDGHRSPRLTPVGVRTAVWTVGSVLHHRAPHRLYSP